MSQDNGTSKRSEKGLLTPDNCVVALIDHQPQMLFGTSNFDRQSIINCTVALGKAARVFDVPVVLTTGSSAGRSIAESLGVRSLEKPFDVQRLLDLVRRLAPVPTPR